MGDGNRFLEAMRVAAFDCVVLHDVDTIAGDERIPYRCPGVGDSSSAVHLAVAVEKYNYTLPFPRYFGGVLVVSREQFAHINGASNVYFGWGGEGASCYTFTSFFVLFLSYTVSSAV